MILILHGAWLPDQKKFFLWGESLNAVPLKGKPPKRPPHPFQSSVEQLRQRAAVADSKTHPLTLWLPSTNKTPIPSPELVATGAAAPKGSPTLKAWRVTGLLLSVNAAIDFLLALPPHHIGADLIAWRTTTLLAMEIIASQQVMPSLVRDGKHLKAQWQPRPTPTTSQKITALTRSLPPLCRAAVDDPDNALTPRALVDDFLATTIDATLRGLAIKPALKPVTIGGKWLAALLGKNDQIDLTAKESDSLFKEWQTWAHHEHVAGDDSFRITFRLELPESKRDSWALSYLLQATDDPTLLVPAAKIWREKGRTLKYFDRRFDQPQERMLKGLGYAARVFPPIDSSLRLATPDQAKLSTTEAFTFLKEAAPLLEQSGFGILIPSWWNQKSRLQARAKVSAKSSAKNEKGRLNFESLVNFQWELTLGGEKISREEFERLAALKQPLVQVRGQWVGMDPDQVQAALKFFEKQQGEMSLVEAMTLGLGVDGESVPAGVEFGGVEATGWLADVFARLNDSHQLDHLPAPRQLKATLRPYQLRGFSWLTFLRQFGFGACLADDMGLGKTIQTISLLLHERDTLKVKAPALIVCPTSVVGNWAREFERFAPTIKAHIHRGVERHQGEAFENTAKAHDVVLTSYPLLMRDRATLTNMEWGTVVLDEAQNIKNSSAKQAQAARALKANNRVALTGTPVENRLSELWSIMAFLNPGYLGSEESFRKNFARPIERTADAAATESLRRLTTPFMLRRLKTDKTIISDLPDKMEMKVYCPLTKEQATLYQAIVKDALAQVEAAQEEGDPMKRRGLVLAMLMKLKQACNHPALFLKDGSELPERSGKVSRLTEMLEEVCAEGDRALIFTQFAEMGGMLEPHLRETLNEEVLFLHGGTKAKERDEMVRRFQSPDGPKIFLLSLKAGGTGLNLTSANHVFHFDRWWNPAVENQATDRAFRIGQTRNVQVRKFICGGTMEDHIDEMIEGKKALAESVLGAGEGWLTELSTKQLRELVTLRQEAVMEA